MNIHPPFIHELRIKQRWVPALLAAMLIWPLTAAHPGGANAQGNPQTFPQTGKTVGGKFLDYWQTHGGLAQQGYPISDQMQEVSDTDGKSYTVQYFERAVFELHPENQAPNDVLLSLLGTFLYKQKYPNGAPKQTPNNEAGSQLFQATGHRVGGLFLDYWNGHGGLAQQGYPISDEFQETSDLGGKTYKVQYFERAVFELHPENQPPYNVLLSQLGTFRYKAKYLQPATPTPPAAEPTATVQQPASPVGTIAATIRGSLNDVCEIAYGAGAIWVTGIHGQGVERIDPRSNLVVAYIRLDHAGFGVVATDQAVWVVTGGTGIASALVRIDPSTNQIVSTLPVGEGDALAMDNNTLWVGSRQQGTVMRVDPGSNKVVATIQVFDASKLPGGPDVSVVSSVAAGNGQVWAADPVGRAVARIDPETNTVAERVPVGIMAGALSLLGNTLWVGSAADGKVARLDLSTKKVLASIDAPLVRGILATDSAVWFGTVAPGVVWRVDPATNAVVGKLTLEGDGGVYGLVAALGAIWVTDRPYDQVLKIVPTP
jgi:streptogramin lyase